MKGTPHFPRLSCVRCRKEGRAGSMAQHFDACFSDRPARLFWEKVDKSAGPEGCWLYLGFLKWDGYGWLARHINGKVRYLTAHRYAWILTNGNPPDGMHILHQCDNPPCCNPKHLKLGTHAENMAEMAARGRANSGGRSRPALWPDRVRPVKETA